MGEPEQLTTRSSRVKAARRLARRASRASARRFLAEGPQSVREALTPPSGCVEVFATAAATAHYPELRAAAAAVEVPWRLADDDAVAGLSGTMTPQGLVAVCEFLDVDLAGWLSSHPRTIRLVALCASVRDPGNAGTVTRCADAAGADLVVFAGTSVDPYNPKAVRASAGSLFHLPMSFGCRVEEAVTLLHDAGVIVLAADAGGSLGLDEAAESGLLARPTAWMFGNEAWGIPEDESAQADYVVRVPIYGHAESLNLATAAAVCLYTSARAQLRERPARGAAGRSGD
ncbi:MAG: TrmH family RNA methyltransferase [Nocardioidaceae bacterium]